MNGDAEILKKLLANQIQQSIKRIIYHGCGINLRYARLVQHSKSINVIHHTNRLKMKNHMIISVDAEKVFDKIQHQVMIKAFSKLGLEGNFLNLIKHIYKNSQLTSYLMVRKQKLFH